MSYINFDKNQLVNLEYSLNKEVLRSNRAGSNACTTIMGCNTRKYHGLLVTPQPAIDGENHVLLSAMDITILKKDAEYTRWKNVQPVIVGDIFNVVLSLGGMLTGEHGVGLTRKKYLPQALGQVQVDLLRQIKRAFDPHHILNPGKIFD